MAPAKRELTFLLADPERRLLRAVAARLPAVVTPDHLTAVGGYWPGNPDSTTVFPQTMRVDYVRVYQR